MIRLITNKYKFEGEFQSEIPNLDFYSSKTLSEQISIMYEPSICIILQGAKDVIFENESYNYNEKEYLVASTHLPARIKIIKATQKEPYISLRIKFNLEEIHEVIKNINSSITPNDKHAEKLAGIMSNHFLAGDVDEDKRKLIQKTRRAEMSEFGRSVGTELNDSRAFIQALKTIKHFNNFCLVQIF